VPLINTLSGDPDIPNVVRAGNPSVRLLLIAERASDDGGDITNMKSISGSRSRRELIDL
jgi:hypothetical protein